jgi:hypothetical protein
MKKYTTIFTIVCLLIAGTAFSQNHWRVNNAIGIDADFKDIQSAFDSATAGDIIYIEGTNIPYGSATASKPFTIIGTGYFLAVNDSTQANLAPSITAILTLNSGAEGTYMAGLTTSSLRIGASNVIIERNNLSNISIGYNNDVGNIVIRQNYINSISDHNYYSSAVIQNNIVTYNISSSIKANWLIYNNTFYSSYTSNSGLINVYNSSIKNNIVINTSSSVNYHCINTSPEQNNNIGRNVCNKEPYNMPVPGNNIWTAEIDAIIINEGSAEQKLYLAEGSPAIGYGEGGIDCGAYGGLKPYILSGMPPVPHIFKASVPVSATTTSGLPVNVKIKSQK